MSPAWWKLLTHLPAAALLLPTVLCVCGHATGDGFVRAEETQPKAACHGIGNEHKAPQSPPVDDRGHDSNCRHCNSAPYLDTANTPTVVGIVAEQTVPHLWALMARPPLEHRAQFLPLLRAAGLPPPHYQRSVRSLSCVWLI